MRHAAIGLCALAFAAASAFAQEPGVGLSVQSLPGGRTTLFNSPQEAQAACTSAGGGFGLRDGKWVCMNARKPLQSTRTAAPAAPAPAAQAVEDDPPLGVAVESLTLRPGESASFVLAPGISHQLLRRVAPSAAGAITVNYEMVQGASRITAAGGAGTRLAFRVLADPDGNGGFSAMGEMTIAGDGTAATRTWPGSLGTITVGEFRAVSQ